MFEKLGCKLYNSDKRAKVLYFIPEIRSKIIELFSENVYISENEIDKDFLFDIIFNDQDKLKSLNDVLFPFIKEDFKEFVKIYPNDIVILESAILFESAIYKDMDFNILVTAPEHIRIERVIKRNNILRDKVEQCIKNQWPDDKKSYLSDFEISNIDLVDSEQDVLKIMKILTIYSK